MVFICPAEMVENELHRAEVAGENELQGADVTGERDVAHDEEQVHDDEQVDDEEQDLIDRLNRLRNDD